MREESKLIKVKSKARRLVILKTIHRTMISMEELRRLCAFRKHTRLVLFAHYREASVDCAQVWCVRMFCKQCE